MNEPVYCHACRGHCRLDLTGDYDPFKKWASYEQKYLRRVTKPELFILIEKIFGISGVRRG